MRKSLGSLFFTASLLTAGSALAAEPVQNAPSVDLTAEEAAARADLSVEKAAARAGLTAEPAAAGAELTPEEAAAGAVVDMWQQMWEDEEIGLFDEVFSHDSDMVIFGTEATEDWVGYETARESMELQLDTFEDGEGTVRNQVVKVDESGETAWFSEMMDLEITAGDERVELTVWFSGVMEKRNDAWTIVQFHSSVPVAGQAVES